ncbi:MAG: hypothetical protein H7249_17220 [Chitinophagaceae bacterium]|nr:hypothetical protein [Oligoflexus sp.]
MKTALTYALLATGVFTAEAAGAFPYDVLQTDTLAKESATLKHNNQGQLKTKVIVLDGEIKTEGTDSTIDSHVLINEVRFMQQAVFSPNLAARVSAPVYFMYEKEESKDQPRIVTEAAWVEAQPRFDLIYSTTNNLDITLGADTFYVRNYDERSKAETFSSHDAYHAAFYGRPHLVIVKHGGTFDAGFTYQIGVEKNRDMTKSNTIDNSVFKFKDVLFEPTTVSVFFRRELSLGSVYGEFAAIEASGGGNKTEKGATSEEDYFKVQVGGAIPLASRSLVLEPTLIYKSLSYADNRNVTLATIPGFGLHLDLNFDNAGLPLFVGIILVKGTDGQSLKEFNANYKVFGYGATVGLNWGF